MFALFSRVCRFTEINDGDCDDDDDDDDDDGGDCDDDDDDEEEDDIRMYLMQFVCLYVRLIEQQL